MNTQEARTLLQPKRDKDMNTPIKDNNIVWGFDEDGDFGFKSDDRIAVFYKWHDAVTLPEQQYGFTELTDGHSKNLWRKIKKAIAEFKEEEGL